MSDGGSTERATKHHIPSWLRSPSFWTVAIILGATTLGVLAPDLPRPPAWVAVVVLVPVWTAAFAVASLYFLNGYREARRGSASSRRAFAKGLSHGFSFLAIGRLRPRAFGELSEAKRRSNLADENVSTQSHHGADPGATRAEQRDTGPLN